MIVGKLKEIMERNGASIRDLSVKAGVTERTIVRLRGGEFRKCRLDTLEALAGALRVDVKDLFDERE
ncbi:hypothetical protein JCM15519_25650 [Fundidesulfovibrio butyratiphilus]